jgi:glycosyltransferase involved in cell wall biosynthesis
VGVEQDLELSVVIPCLNESTTIGSCVETAKKTIRKYGIRGEVVVSDNGSTDQSIEIAAAAGARVVSCPIRGYGAALQWGFRQSLGRFVLMGDGDESYDFALLPRFLDRVRMGSKFVIGSRLRGNIEPGAMPLLHRYLGTPVLTWTLNGLFGTRISDCNCGMRCLDRATVLSLGIVSSGMEFASEMVVKAAIQQVHIDEIPIDFHRDRRNRRPHLRPFRDGWRHLRLLLWHAPDHMMTLPGLIMLALGLPFVLLELMGPVSLGSARFDIHYMILGVTLCLIGVSSSTLGLVVGSTMPAGRVRLLRSLIPAHSWFTFDKASWVAGLLFLLGVGSDAFVLAFWLYTGRGELTPIYTRLTLMGLVLIAVSAQVGLSALVLGTTTSSVPTAEVRDLVASPLPVANEEVQMSIFELTGHE